MARKSSSSSGNPKFSALFEGLTPLMFDRYAGDNKTSLPVEQKMYFAPDGKTLIFPAANVTSFLCAQNTDSAVKKVYESKVYKRMAQAILASVMVSPPEIPITRKGKPIIFNGFDGDIDEEAGMRIHRCVARLKGGVPNPKVRPVIDLPWEMRAELTIFPNEEKVDGNCLLRLFEVGGLALGFGTYRGVFGKFRLAEWKEIA